LPRISELLKQYLGEANIELARKRRGIFYSWYEIIEAAFEKKETAELCAEHTHISGITNGTLSIKADHTGWIQILQAQKESILDVIKQKFPEVTINEIEFGLG
jgi:predicted nucleic acid-binding Zn ribbon protein